MSENKPPFSSLGDKSWNWGTFLASGAATLLVSVVYYSQSQRWAKQRRAELYHKALNLKASYNERPREQIDNTLMSAADLSQYPQNEDDTDLGYDARYTKPFTITIKQSNGANDLAKSQPPRQVNRISGSSGMTLPNQHLARSQDPEATAYGQRVTAH